MMDLHRMLIVKLVFLWAMMNPAASQASNTPSDQSALLSFKGSMSDPLGALSSWNQTLPFCHWPGLTCSRRHPGRVTSLDLDSLNLAGPISASLANLSFLQRLHLPGNQLYGHIPWALGRLFRLRHLNLSVNSLKGEIPDSLTQCSKLQFLSLRDNMLQGIIPANLSLLQGLEYISLSNNMLTGVVPAELGSLPKLSILNLRRNNLTGSIPSSLGNLSSLTILDLSENKLEGSIPHELGRLTQLGAFDVILNELSGYVPLSLYNISSMYYLGLGGNQLHGALPSNIGDTLPILQRLVLHGNWFHGAIPASLLNASGLGYMDFSLNNFTGLLPPNLGKLANLVWLTIDYNQIEAGDGKGWEFLDSLTNCTNLEYLSLYNNKLEGPLPSSIANLSTSLSFLAIGQNQLSGSIPEGIGNLVGLTILAIDQNHFSGTIPSSLGRLRNLSVLRLFQNELSGSIPSSLGNITQLSRLLLGANNLVGSIPTSFAGFQSLELLDLSKNNLTGPMPKELGSIASLSRYLDLSHNSLVGSIPPEIGRLKNLQAFDVSENKLSGEIPSAIGGCEVLQYLHVDGNSLQGSIPQTLINLKGVQDIDLSRNFLSGSIPEFLQDLRSLHHLNLSFNDFDGAVPTKGVFANVTMVSITGNNNLCGGNPGLHLPPCSATTSKRKHSSTLRIIILIASSCLCVVLVSILLFARSWIIAHRKKSVSPQFLKDQHLTVSYNDLLKATDGFSASNLIGTGSFGSVYKGFMDQDHRVIAVKVLNLQQRGASKTFNAECEALRSIRHRNLMKILSVCSSADFKGNDFKALVYEFMPNGSLEKWLHTKLSEIEECYYLNLYQRLKIAIDVASAMEYLHHHGKTPIVHCDIKPSNILLDNDMNAHVGDFGLTRFLHKVDKASSQNVGSSVGIKGSIGYVAPEYGVSGEVSTQGDVYSYGILLLEMFTGKMPTDGMFRDGFSLHQFVASAYPENIMSTVDPQLALQEEAGEVNSIIQRTKGQSKMQDCFLAVMKVGLQCSKESPKERMDMGDVTVEMNATRKRFFGAGIRELP